MDTKEIYAMVNDTVHEAIVMVWDNSTLLVSSREIKNPTLTQLNEALDNPF